MNLLDLARAALANRADTTVPPVAAESGAYRRWAIVFPNLHTMEVIFAPEATRAEVAAIYPGATITPLPDLARRPGRQAEATELRRLIRLVLADVPHEWDEAEAAALTDVDAALECFRTLAGELEARA